MEDTEKMRRNKRKTAEEKKTVDPRKVKSFFTCHICSNIMNQATTITLCLDTFCWKCINDHITEHGCNYCPICLIDLGSQPLRRIRRDQQYERLTDTLFPQEQKDVEMESKTSEVSSSSSSQKM